MVARKVPVQTSGCVGLKKPYCNQQLMSHRSHLSVSPSLCLSELTVAYGGLQVDASEDESEEVQEPRSVREFARNHSSHESSLSRNI